MYMPHEHRDQKKESDNWGQSYRWFWVTLHKCLETNLGPLEEQQALLGTEPSLQPLIIHFYAVFLLQGLFSYYADAF